jgi:branched-chain amino acid transport system substrate-binding protein
VVKDAMAAIKFEGVSGEITYDQFGNPIKKAVIIQVKDGKKTFVKFVAPAAAEEAAPTGGFVSGIPPAPDFPIKVAMLFPLTGDVSTFGISSKQGVEMAFDAAKANGWQIDVVVGDSRCDAAEAANVANKVITQDKVKYIIGEVCSSASIPVSEIANPAKVLQISPTSTNPQVTVDKEGKHKPYTFRACFLDPFQGEVVATFAVQDLGAKTAAVMYDNGNDYVKGLAEYFKASFEELGGTVPVYEAYAKEDTDFSAILSKVADASPDVLFLPDYYNKVSLIGKQAKEKGIKSTMLGGDGWDSAELDMAAVDGGYHSNHYSPADPRPIVQDFVKAYTDKHGAEPDALATLAYDAANILLWSVANAGVDDPSVVKDSMASIKFEGVSGEITYDQFGNPIKKAVIIQVKDGKKTFVKFVAPQ